MRIQCPKCQGLLDVEGAAAGTVVACGHCNAHLQVPEVQTKPNPAPARSGRPPASPKSSGVAKQLANQVQAAQREAVAAREEEAETTPRPKRKKKKKRPAYRPEPEFNPYQAEMWMAVACGLFVWGLLIGLSFLVHGLVWILILAGLLMTAVGRWWFLGIAAEEGISNWLMCMLIPFYSTYYFFTRLGDTLYPFLVGAAGYMFIITGLLLLLHFGGLGVLLDGAEGFEDPLTGTLKATLDGKDLGKRPAGLLHQFHSDSRHHHRFFFTIEDDFGSTLHGELPRTFDGNWKSLAGTTLRLLPEVPGEDGAISEFYKDEDDEEGVPMASGTFQVERVEGTAEKPVLVGRLQVKLKGNRGELEAQASLPATNTDPRNQGGLMDDDEE